MAKVCILTLTSCKRSADTRLLKEATTLKKAGYDIDIIASLGVNTVPYEEMDSFRISRISFAPLPGFLQKVGLVKSNESQKKNQNTCQFQLEEPTSRAPKEASVISRAFSYIIRFLRRLLRLIYSNYFGYVIYYYRVFQLVRRESIDIYHAHDLMTLPVAWLLACRTKGKLVYDSHELWLDRNRGRKRSRFNRFLVKKIESFLIRRTDANMVVSDSIASELSKRYHITKPRVILNAPSYSPVERSNILHDNIGIPAEEKIIIYIGAITFNRGLEEVIQSLKYLARCNLVLMGYGDPDYIVGLKELINDEALTDRVHFFGPVPYEEVTRYAASADIGVAPIKNVCLSYYYCSPNKVFECIAAGLPVVGSNFPDIKMVIEGHHLGVTFDPGSPRDIARAIEYVLSDKHRYEEMSKNALEAAKIFNWQNESKKLLAIYERLSDIN